MKTASTIYRSALGSLSLRGRRRRAVSEVIATLLLMGVTVVGGVLAMTMVRGFTDDTTGVGQIKVKEVIRLIGYDTRDNGDLAGIERLDNEKDSPTPRLCTASCAANNNMIPDSSGTDFIVIYLHNAGLDDVFLDDILVSTNNIVHEWDGETAGENIDTTTDDTGPTDHSYPHDGKYSIVDEVSTVHPVSQRSDTVIAGGQVVRVVIKLSDQISSDIDIDDSIPIIVTTAESSTFDFVVHGGSVL